MLRKHGLDPESQMAKRNKNSGQKASDKVVISNQIKSPSDTTIYAPALIKTPEKNNKVVRQQLGFSPVSPDVVKEQSLIEKISQFVESVRSEQKDSRHPVLEPQPGTSREAGGGDRGLQLARQIATEKIVGGERYKANIEKPQGKNIRYSVSPQRHFFGTRQASNEDILDDDEFFHITCHVDRNLAVRIERGEYVDLEKLLVKDRYRQRDDERLEFVNKEGHTFLAPVSDREPKINGIRRWEQAFRIYAAIYSKANPERSAEIWQYVYTINSAASNYIWENVAYYDFTFRQMMGLHPRRSWAKIFNQLWNMALCHTNSKGG